MNESKKLTIKVFPFGLSIESEHMMKLIPLNTETPISLNKEIFNGGKIVVLRCGENEICLYEGEFTQQELYEMVKERLDLWFSYQSGYDAKVFDVNDTDGE